MTGCGHTKGKAVVSRGEAYARIQAACDARNEGKDIFVLARTDALIHGWEEALARALEFKRIGVDAVFVEALPDRESMQRCVRELDMPVFANSKSPPFPSSSHINMVIITTDTENRVSQSSRVGRRRTCPPRTWLSWGSAPSLTRGRWWPPNSRASVRLSKV